MFLQWSAGPGKTGIIKLYLIAWVWSDWGYHRWASPLRPGTERDKETERERERYWGSGWPEEGQNSQCFFWVTDLLLMAVACRRHGTSLLHCCFPQPQRRLTRGKMHHWLVREKTLYPCWRFMYQDHTIFFFVSIIFAFCASFWWLLCPGCNNKPRWYCTTLGDRSLACQTFGLFTWSASPFGLRCATKVIRAASAHTCRFPEEKAETMNNNAEWALLAAPSIMRCPSPRKASENPRSQGCAWLGLSSTHSPMMIKVQMNVARYILLSRRRAIQTLTVNHLWATSLSFYSTFLQTVYLPVNN